MYLKNKIELLFSISFIWVMLFSFSSCKEKKQVKEVNPFEVSDTLISHMTVGIAKVTQVKSELKLTGKITADQNKQLDVFALVAGTVKDVRVELGDYVQKDEVLAVIHSGDAADYEKQFIEASSDYEVAQKNKAVAEDMYASKLISSSDYLQAKQEFNKAEAGLTKAKEMQKIYSVSNTSDYLIKSPISGFVIEKNINKDMQIRADNGNNIFTVSQLSDVWVIANVYETDIDKVKVNDTVIVTTIAYPDKPYNAVIDKIYNVLDPQSRVMKIRIKLNNPDYLLKPDMYGSVQVNYTEPLKMLTIPSTALVFDNSNNYVVLYNGGKNFTVQKVDIYKTIGLHTYLRSGLKENDKVVTTNQLLIYNTLTNN